MSATHAISATLVTAAKNTNNHVSPRCGIITWNTAAVNVPALSISDETTEMADLSFCNYLVNSIEMTPDILLYGPP